MTEPEMAPHQIDAALLELLACPQSRHPLRHDTAAAELVCTDAACGLAYPIRDGIPVLLIAEARSTGAPGADA